MALLRDIIQPPVRGQLHPTQPGHRRGRPFPPHKCMPLGVPASCAAHSAVEPVEPQCSGSDRISHIILYPLQHSELSGFIRNPDLSY